MPNKLAGEVAIVTGASKGIGAAISKTLAAEGAAVVVNYSSSQDAAAKIVADITAAGGKAVAVKANVAQQADIEFFLPKLSALSASSTSSSTTPVCMPRRRSARSPRNPSTNISISTSSA